MLSYDFVARRKEEYIIPSYVLTTQSLSNVQINLRSQPNTKLKLDMLGRALNVAIQHLVSHKFKYRIIPVSSFYFTEFVNKWSLLRTETKCRLQDMIAMYSLEMGYNEFRSLSTQTRIRCMHILKARSIHWLQNLIGSHSTFNLYWFDSPGKGISLTSMAIGIPRKPISTLRNQWV